MKKIIIGFIVGALMFGIIPVMAQEGLTVLPNPFPVVIDGVVTEVEGYNINGYTFLKLADFGKAGLTVKFNETDKQIEISSTEKAIITPEPENEPVPEPVKGEKPMDDVQQHEKGNYDIVVKDGVKYNMLGLIHMEVLRGTDYRIDIDKASQSLALIRDKTEIVLADIPYLIYEGRTYVQQDYYQNTILPIVQGSK